MREVEQGTPTPKWPDGTGSPRVRHLLTVARALFVDRGFDAVSIDAIARAAGVSKETIYRYFKDKESLFRAALDAADEEFIARVSAVHVDACTGTDELADLALAILDSAVDQGLFRTLWIAVAVAERMPDLAADLRDGHGRTLEPVRDALQHYARSRGVNRQVGHELALDFGSLAVEGPALLMGFAPPAGAARAGVARRAAALFANGVGGKLEGKGQPDPCKVPKPRAKKSPAHIRALLDVAGAAFLAEGYESTNLDAIGTQARVGRGTLYRHFGSKAGLFDAAMRAVAEDCAQTPPCPPLAWGVIDRTQLRHFLEAAIESLASPTSILLHRAVIAQSHRTPGLARDIFTIQRAPWIACLTGWLTSLSLDDDAQSYALQLLVLALRGNRVLAGGGRVTDADRRRYAERALTIFLDGFVALL